jgi:hypothetical protein
VKASSASLKDSDIKPATMRVLTDPVIKEPERSNVSNSEVVRRQQSNMSASLKGFLNVISEDLDPRTHDKCDQKIDPRIRRITETTPKFLSHSPPMRRDEVSASRVQIVPKVRDYMPYSTPWIGHITVVAGYHVHMEMGHRLSGSRTRIDSDVVAIRLIPLIQFNLDKVNQFEDRMLLINRRIEPCGDWSPGDDE